MDGTPHRSDGDRLIKITFFLFSSMCVRCWLSVYHGALGKYGGYNCRKTVVKHIPFIWNMLLYFQAACRCIRPATNYGDQ